MQHQSVCCIMICVNFESHKMQSRYLKLHTVSKIVCPMTINLYMNNFVFML